MVRIPQLWYFKLSPSIKVEMLCSDLHGSESVQSRNLTTETLKFTIPFTSRRTGQKLL